MVQYNLQMSNIKKIAYYLNPIKQLGVKNYSIVFPLIGTLGICLMSELFAYHIAKNPHSIDTFAIVGFIGLIVYFSFRNGIRGGLITTLITIFYYLYIIYSRHYVGQQFQAGIETTGTLAILYLFITSIIGWLKQTIDALIEREANEKKRLHSVIQQLPVGVLIADQNGKIVQANKQVSEILGRKIPLGHHIGKDEPLVQSRLRNKPVRKSNSPLLQALLTGKEIPGKEYAFIKNEKEHTIQVSASPILNNKGKVIAAASIIADITEQKQLEKRKDDFINMASHELKTPLTSMMLYIDSLMNYMKKRNNKKEINILGNIQVQTKKLHELVSDLLDVSKINTGKLSFDKETFRLDELIKEIVQDMQRISTHHITFTSKVKATVFADKFRIYQVITNLLTNAIKYSSEKKQIIVNVKNKKEFILVSVQDFGIGIAKDQQQKIFERLYQVVDATEKTFPGLGMGLYISKEIIKKHGGKIWVESEKGKGSIFYFTIPMNKK